MFDFLNHRDFNFKGGTKEVEFSAGFRRPQNALEFVKDEVFSLCRH